jgi:SAM-dependent methyltransferase
LYILERSLNFIRNAVASYGPSIIKKALWDREYSAGDWDFNDNTEGDCVYPHLEKHAEKGSILDIGCGSGNTANELPFSAYCSYVGVDISEVALDKARRWSEWNGRAGKNSFVQADFLKYLPDQQFDVILFRESLYLVPLGKVKEALDRYSKHLKDSGVFIVRICTTRNNQRKYRPTAMVRAIESGFEVLERRQYGELGPTVIVFQPVGRQERAAGLRSARIH